MTLQCWDTLGEYAMPFPSARSDRVLDIEHAGFRFLLAFCS